MLTALIAELIEKVEQLEEKVKKLEERLQEGPSEFNFPTFPTV